MAFRNYLTTKLTALILPLAVSCGDNGLIPPGNCGTDNDCNPYQICSLSGQCIQKGNCIVDNDCSGSLVCENGECVSYSSKEPKQVLNDFADSLKSGNLEKALSQVHPESKTLRGALSGKFLPEELMGFNYGLSLMELGAELKNIDLTLSEEFGNYRDYTAPCGDNYDCLFRFKKDENGQWKIERF